MNLAYMTPPGEVPPKWWKPLTPGYDPQIEYEYELLMNSLNETTEDEEDWSAQDTEEENQVETECEEKS